MDQIERLIKKSLKTFFKQSSEDTKKYLYYKDLTKNIAFVNVNFFLII